MATAPKATNKRDAVMNAALELFVARGFYGTAVPEIADKAEVGAGTIYRYFPSKEALVNELYRQEKTRFGAAVVTGFPAGNARELFHMLWRRMVDFAVEHQQSFQFLELQHHAAYLDAESHALESRMTKMFEQIIESAQQRGELKAGSPALLMGLVMGAFIGVIRSCVEVDLDPASADWKLAEQCMWEAIRA
ncbi:MAG: TetR/AcrR family transcriptional regulator [Kofleriaceae bacterium]